MSSGTSLWDELIDRYDRGLRTIAANKREWEAMRPLVDPERHAAVAANLARQHSEAKWWRDASIAYWQSLSHLQLAPGHSAPRHSLPWYEAVRFDTVPGYQNAGTGHQPSCAPPVGGPPCQL
jgi:alpha-glucuronidase